MKKILLKFVLPVFLMPSIVFATHNEPLSVVQAGGKAVKERDGKKQYQLLCPDQQKKNRATLETANWVTGVSSPQIGGFRIARLKKKQDSTEFLIIYQIILSSKSVGSVSDQLRIKNGCITQFNYLSPSDERPTR